MRQRPKPFDAPGLTLIERARRYHGLTLRDIEQRTGASRGLLAKVMHGYLPNLQVAFDLARLFGVTVDELWGEAIPVKNTKPGKPQP